MIGGKAIESLPSLRKTQYLHFRFHASYFLLPWKITEEISRRSMLFHSQRQYLPHHIKHSVDTTFLKTHCRPIMQQRLQECTFDNVMYHSNRGEQGELAQKRVSTYMTVGNYKRFVFFFSLTLIKLYCSIRGQD